MHHELQEELESRLISAEDLIYSPEFIPFYPEIAQNYNLNVTETLLYGFIRFYLQRSKNTFFFTNKQLAKVIKSNKELSETSISIAINKLISVGLIDVKYKIKANGGKIRNIIFLNSEFKKTETPSLRKLKGNNNNIKYTNISKEILQENPDKEEIKKPLVAKKENRKITNLVSAICQILNVSKLDGTVKDNRYMAKHLLDDIDKAKIPIAQFFECFTNCVEDCKEFRNMTSLREIRNKFPKIMKIGSDIRARGYKPGYLYTKYHYIKGNNYITTETFQIDVHGNKIDQNFEKSPISDFDPEYLKGRGWL